MIAMNVKHEAVDETLYILVAIVLEYLQLNRISMNWVSNTHSIELDFQN